jgi:hypothetical protein
LRTAARPLSERAATWASYSRRSRRRRCAGRDRTSACNDSCIARSVPACSARKYALYVSCDLDDLLCISIASRCVTNQSHSVINFAQVDGFDISSVEEFHHLTAEDFLDDASAGSDGLLSTHTLVAPR